MNKRWMIFLVSLLVISGWQLTRAYFQADEQLVRTELRHAVEEQFSEQAASYKSRYGIRPYHFAGTGSRNGNVILVHGLDEPGKVWMNLAPALKQQSLNVWIFDYPNDQPVTSSAALFHDELTRLKQNGMQSTNIVSHSMGGLVSRDLLSNPALACSNPPCKADQRPAINKLIMVGTPNHGSELARMRALAELREQATLFLQGKMAFLGWIFDGAGEAGIDLTPGSPFLLALNDRPLAAATDHLVIAGVIGNDERQQLQDELAGFEELDPFLDSIDQGLERLGDGMVSLEAAKLEGARLEIVPGNHTTIIRNLTESSDRIPPAIPIILRELQPQP